jgi:hypothetical protein
VHDDRQVGEATALAVLFAHSEDSAVKSARLLGVGSRTPNPFLPWRLDTLCLGLKRKSRSLQQKMAL